MVPYIETRNPAFYYTGTQGPFGEDPAELHCRVSEASQTHDGCDAYAGLYGKCVV